MKKATRKYASLVLMILVVFVMLFGTMSTAYASEYKKIEDLNGKKIGVQTGCIY